ncbi:TetR/AcrR family transcriptional regulator [Prolixibacter sp. SD074]|uniref:TetR/AcrR family transcriptional regulator n=1 Tax=Prolixibacter sp. SD074 TaxID=2652391 RepID=UPI00126BED70|nr:TetR/AcrR family transcriptional regulator [Prolixibacter sp. SD074]GET30901.1 AcrR family transcriptional regulator [Prolixibacter sp. SD074]
MRLKDEDKIIRIYQAAVKLINIEGFQGTSVSKIAREANLAPATLYLYFENKEDMLNKLYLHLERKKSMAYIPTEAHLEPTKETFQTIWKRHCQFIRDYPLEFRFLENFSNCPLIEKINQEEGVRAHQPLFDLFEAARQKDILRNLSNQLIYTLFFAPVTHTVKQALNRKEEPDVHILNEIFEAAWRSVAV